MDDINKKSSEIGFIEKSFKLDNACKVCKYYKVCRGGCQRNRDLNPDTGLYSNYFCESYKIFFDACYDKIMDIVESLRQKWLKMAVVIMIEKSWSDSLFYSNTFYTI